MDTMPLKGPTQNPLTSRPREQIIEAEISWIASLVLFFSTVYVTLNLDVLWMAFGVTALSLYVLPIVTMRDPFRALPWEMTLLLAAPLLLHISSGAGVLEETFDWWDDFTSLAFSFSLATIGFLLTIELQIYTDVRMHRGFAIFFVFMFTLGVSGFWHLGQYLDDVFFGTNHIASNDSVMRSLVWTLVGGVVMGFVYAAYLKAVPERRQKTLGLIHLWEVPKWERD